MNAFFDFLHGGLQHFLRVVSPAIPIIHDRLGAAIHILTWIGGNSRLEPQALDATAYKQARQRMYGIVKNAVGATNVKLAYTPIYFNTGYGTYKDDYPGDQYVDWVGVDDY